jgi:hypothetical protein
MMIGMEIERKVDRNEGNGTIMKKTGMRNSSGSEKNNSMFGEDGLEVKRHKGCHIGLNGMELCNNVRMRFFEDIFHVIGTDDLKGT